MAEESIAEKLARLKRDGASLYEPANDLRYDAEPEIEPAEELLALRSEPDPAREYEWICEMRSRDTVAALFIRKEPFPELFVYPKGGRRFTLQAFRKFGDCGAKSNGLVAKRLVYSGEDAEHLLSRLVEIAEQDADPAHRANALSLPPRQWLAQNPYRCGDWLPGFGTDRNDGRMDTWWWEFQHWANDRVPSSVLESYEVYLENCPDLVLAPRTGIIENTYALAEREEPEVVACLELNDRAVSLSGCELPVPVLSRGRWLGWPKFHEHYETAEGLSMFSRVGYSEDGQRAFFTRFNRADPRLLEPSNQNSSTLEFVEWVWLELQEGKWRVSKTRRFRSLPLDGLIPGSQPLITSSWRDWPLFEAPRDPTRVCNTVVTFRPPLAEPVPDANLVLTDQAIRFGSTRLPYRSITRIEVAGPGRVAISTESETHTLAFEDKDPEILREFFEVLEWPTGLRNRTASGSIELVH